MVQFWTRTICVPATSFREGCVDQVTIEGQTFTSLFATSSTTPAEKGTKDGKVSLTLLPFYIPRRCIVKSSNRCPQ